jgi:FdhD protein
VKSQRSNPAIRRVKIRRLSAGGRPGLRSDSLAVEAPLELRIRGRGVAVTMRTPGHDRELAAGFLLTERIITERRELKDIAACRGSLEPENTMDIFLATGVEVDFARLTRHVYATSSCGLCGKATIDAVRQQFPPVDSDVNISVATLLRLPKQMRRAQATFAQTGGLHAAAAFNLRGKMLVLREDIGRHNAVDKVIGSGLLAGKFPFAAHVLLVSGRASLEIMQKALAARFPIVCAVSAPSSLAVEFAAASGQTLVGFLRDATLNVYAGAQRIIANPRRRAIRD